MLDDSAKKNLLKLLAAISAADGDIAEEEVALLEKIASGLDYSGDVKELLPKV
jgi:uncharacterized tellurite resistance protein B-like protein